VAESQGTPQHCNVGNASRKPAFGRCHRSSDANQMAFALSARRFSAQRAAGNRKRTRYGRSVRKGRPARRAAATIRTSVNFVSFAPFWLLLARSRKSAGQVSNDAFHFFRRTEPAFLFVLTDLLEPD
jgi:hypothetical protein